MRVPRKRIELRNPWEGGERCAHSADLHIGRGLTGLVIFQHDQEPEMGSGGKIIQLTTFAMKGNKPSLALPSAFLPPPTSIPSTPYSSIISHPPQPNPLCPHSSRKSKSALPPKSNFSYLAYLTTDHLSPPAKPRHYACITHQ